MRRSTLDSINEIGFHCQFHYDYILKLDSETYKDETRLYIETNWRAEVITSHFDDATGSCLECPGKTRRLMNGWLKRLAQVLCYETTLEAESCDILGIYAETRE